MPRQLPLTIREFEEIFSKVPRLCVDLVITNGQGYLLTLRQKHGYINQWHTPGGMVYYREHVLDTVRRIALEEVGIKDIIINRQIGVLEFFSEVEERGYGYSVSLVYLCRLPQDASIVLDSFADKFAFYDHPPENTVREQKEFLQKLDRSIF